MRLTFTLLAMFLAFGLWAQNINYFVEVRYLGWDGRGDQSGGPEYTFKIWARDNVDGSESGGQCFYSGDDVSGGGSNGNRTCSPGGSIFGSGVNIRSRFNTSATSLTFRTDAWEKDCDNDCDYEGSCYLGTIGDDDRAQCNPAGPGVSFRAAGLPPCQWNDFGVFQCGSFYYAVRVYWEWASAPSILTEPSPADNNLCAVTKQRYRRVPEMAEGV
jgi:hypothetical protein